MIKRIFRTLLIFIGLLLVSAMFMPRNFKVERSLLVDASESDLYQQVANFENWDNWEPWMKMDPDAEFKTTGTGIGALREWESEIIGKGSMELIELEENQKVGATLTFYDPNPMASYSYWSFEKQGSKTFVTMGCSGDLDYPLGRIFGLLVSFEDAMAPDFEKALIGISEAAYSSPTTNMDTDSL
jgi:hypothetical protein